MMMSEEGLEFETSIHFYGGLIWSADCFFFLEVVFNYFGYTYFLPLSVKCEKLSSSWFFENGWYFYFYVL